MRSGQRKGNYIDNKRLNLDGCADEGSAHTGSDCIIAGHGENNEGGQETVVQQSAETHRVWRGRPRKAPHSDLTDTAKVKFYEVGLGSERKIEYPNQDPVCTLLDKYCMESKVPRSQVKFEVWDYEVQNDDTFFGLKHNHGIKCTSIDFVMR